MCKKMENLPVAWNPPFSFRNVSSPPSSKRWKTCQWQEIHLFFCTPNSTWLSCRRSIKSRKSKKVENLPGARNPPFFWFCWDIVHEAWTESKLYLAFTRIAAARRCTNGIALFCVPPQFIKVEPHEIKLNLESRYLFGWLPTQIFKRLFSTCLAKARQWPDVQ